jgi:tRNA dimethylallyltransferase
MARSVRASGERPLLVSVVGPTAIGKTATAIAVAQALGTEVISSDSRQFYREIPIGTAQPTAAERACVPHHFVDFLSVQDRYSSGQFEREAVEFLDGFFSSERAGADLPAGRPVAVMAGGSGLYVKAVHEGFDPMPSSDEVREALNAENFDGLLAELERLDPEHYGLVDRNNKHRVIRALEVIRVSGKTYSSFRQSAQEAVHHDAGGWSRSVRRSFDTLTLGLGAPRAVLHERINARTTEMLAAGWLEEARALMEIEGFEQLNALQTVGYPPLFAHLRGELSLANASERIQETTRQFARRQLTWFHKMPNVHWLAFEDGPAQAVALVEKFLRDGEL